MIRVPVLDKNGKPLMPTKPSRARRWLKEGKAKIVHNRHLRQLSKPLCD
ncbi:hypothetical protein NIES4106_38480 [Fischerella sp. NIES-4106]|nr:hypothetical protein NIES4106_38480 [Fischerella sp. NIES-4106]